MAHNLKKFANQAEYEAATLNYPAVSWIVSGDTVAFDKEAPAPPTPTFSGFTVCYYIADPSVEVNLFNGGGSSSSSSSESGSESGGGGAMPTSMIVDGVDETPIATWRFNTAGEHVVQYSFEDNGIIDNFVQSITYITKVEIGNGITSIGNNALEGCSGLTSCTFAQDSQLTSIGNGAFTECNSLTSVAIPSSVTSIGGGAFYGCSSLTSVTIPSSVTSINFEVFYGCSGITSVTIPSSVTSIDGGAFRYCLALTSITINAADPPTLGSRAFDDTSNAPIYVLASSVEMYKTSTSTGWSVYASRIQAIP